MSSAARKTWATLQLFFLISICTSTLLYCTLYIYIFLQTITTLSSNMNNYNWPNQKYKALHSWASQRVTSKASRNLVINKLAGSSTICGYLPWPRLFEGYPPDKLLSSGSMMNKTNHAIHWIVIYLWIALSTRSHNYYRLAGQQQKWLDRLG